MVRIRTTLRLCLVAGFASVVPHVALAQDAVRGKQLYEQRCIGCHSETVNRIGPKHVGVMGRKAGGVADFDYSDALKKSTLIWDTTSLAAWLANPEAIIPGQRMSYRTDNAQDREDIVRYLATLK
jgi:cytochrome c